MLILPSPGAASPANHPLGVTAFSSFLGDLSCVLRGRRGPKGDKP
jgi:hypothetical protein